VTCGTRPDAILVLMPVYNDWTVVPLVLERLDAALASAGAPVEVILVDDGSSETPSRQLFAHARYRTIQDVTALRLTRNLGHQRAIAIGLAYINAHRAGCAVVVMDADGEDIPEHVPRMLEAQRAAPSTIVFAHRARRSEGVVFRVCYRLYRFTHRLLTGAGISFGNFSVVPRALLPRLVCLPELWNHYPSTVVKTRLPTTMLPLDRGSRLAGHSQMRLTALVLHGLGALTVHGDVIGVRALIATIGATLVSAIGILTVIAIRVFTTLAIPGWASFVVGVLAAILLQTLMLALVFVFITLSSRSYSTIVPHRNFRDFVMGEEPLFP
jgi:polyisoprenyl-phosphate glycosyltransferase